MSIEEIKTLINKNQRNWLKHLIPHIHDLLVADYPILYIQNMLLEKHKIKVSYEALRKLKIRVSEMVAKMKIGEEKIDVKPQAVGKEKNTIVVAPSMNKAINPDSIIRKGATISLDEAIQKMKELNNKKPFDPFDAIIQAQEKQKAEEAKKN